MVIKIKRATWISGEPVKVGETINTDDETARTLIQLGHAEGGKITESAGQPQKPSFTREK